LIHPSGTEDVSEFMLKRKFGLILLRLGKVVWRCVLVAIMVVLEERTFLKLIIQSLFSNLASMGD
jgi:hypothetical protein